jgi:hypothetical protein
VDTHKDLNAYALIEGQGGCCSPAMTSATGLALAACCPEDTAGVHQALADLLRRYNVNDYAASVQVYALKGR